jgi:YHS domain-containing protein
MKAKGLVSLAVVMLMIAAVLVGCKKKEQPAPAAPEAKAAASAVTKAEQTTCPVMDGNKIDKNVFVEYKGKKVYFCCAACKSVFEKDPEKYAANLPQFKK